MQVKFWHGSEKNIVGKKIRELRIERGYSQRDLVRECELLGYPISQNMISRIENGKRRVTDVEMLAFMEVLRVPSASLLEALDKNNYFFRRKM